MKKFLALLLAIMMVFAFAACTEDEPKDQGSGSVAGSSEDKGDKEESENDRIGDYSVVIDSCRLTKDFEDKDVVVVKFIFKNVESDDPAAFYTSVSANVYQNGVGLTEAYILDDSDEYNVDNQMKEIKKGASLEVEVAYELDDVSSEIEVEVTDWIGMDETTITKTFSLS